MAPDEHCGHPRAHHLGVGPDLADSAEVVDVLHNDVLGRNLCPVRSDVRGSELNAAPGLRGGVPVVGNGVARSKTHDERTDFRTAQRRTRSSISEQWRRRYGRAAEREQFGADAVQIVRWHPSVVVAVHRRTGSVLVDNFYRRGANTVEGVLRAPGKGENSPEGPHNAVIRAAY